MCVCVCGACDAELGLYSRVPCACDVRTRFCPEAPCCLPWEVLPRPALRRSFCCLQLQCTTPFMSADDIAGNATMGYHVVPCRMGYRIAKGYRGAWGTFFAAREAAIEKRYAPTD